MDNVYLVGVGYWGSNILKELRLLNKQVTTIDIKDGTTLGNITQKWPVILATPIDQHFSQTEYLLKRNYDVFVEKPMAEKQTECETLRTLEGDNVLMAGHLLIHNPLENKMKELIHNGSIGKVLSVKCERTNWGKRQTNITPVANLAVHDISVVHDLFDDEIIVTDVQSTNYTNNNVPDRVKFKGMIAQIEVECEVSWYSLTRKRVISVIGTQGALVWDNDKNTVVKTNHMIDGDDLVKQITTETFPYEGASPLARELKHFFDCIAYRDQGYSVFQRPKTNVDNAISVAKVIDRIESKIVR